MTLNSREKGARFEREVRDIFRAAGFPECERVPNSGGLWLPSDLARVPGLVIECKHEQRWDVPGYLRQVYGDVLRATLEGDGVPMPLVAFRRNRTNHLDPCGTAHAIVPLADFATIYRKGITT